MSYNKAWRSVVWFAAASALLLCGSTAAGYTYGTVIPSGTLLIRRPTIGVAVAMSPEDDMRAVLVLDGESIPMVYGKGGYWYYPQQAMAPGEYSGTITITGTTASGGRYQALELPVHFAIAENAVTRLPGVSLSTVQAVDAINQIRDKLELSPIAPSRGLQAASEAHARYVEGNESLYATGLVNLHEEPEASAPGFTGIWPENRDVAYGVTDGGNEVMDEAYGYESFSGFHAGNAISNLMDTIWHRMILLSSGTVTGGVGLVQGYGQNVPSIFVMDLGMTGSVGAPSVTEYPYPGQQGVQKTFWGEYPNPLAGRTTASEAGYPITLTFNDPNVTSVQVTSAVLSDSAGVVATWEYDDHTWTDTSPVYTGIGMGNSVALIAKKPLTAGTRYTVAIVGSLQMANGSGSPFDRQWSFTTREGSTPNVWKQGGYVFATGASLTKILLHLFPSEGYRWSEVQQIGKLIVMPAAGITEISEGDGEIPYSAPPFPEAPSWGVRDVYAALAAGWIWVRGAGHFSAVGAVSQAQALTMIYRAMGEPGAVGMQASGVDVGGFPSWAQSAAEWAVGSGVVTDAARVAEPNAPVSKAQYTAWVVRALVGSGRLSGKPPTFVDAGKIPARYEGAVGWAQRNGLVSGASNNAFRGGEQVTGAQAAVLLVRAFLG